MEDRTSEEEWLCELQNADAEQTGFRFVTLEGLDDIDLNVQATSGRTTLLAKGAEIINGALKVPKGSEKSWDMIEKRGPAEKKRQENENNGNGNSNGNGNGNNGKKPKTRLLAPALPDFRSVLAVRVKAPDSVTTADLKTLSDDIFGADGTAVNLSERFNSCSYGETQMIPYAGSTPSGVSIQDGVVEVEITKSVTGKSKDEIRTAVLAELTDYLGISDLNNADNGFDHVMLCLPPGTSGTWIASGKSSHSFLFSNE
jgi:hypothetical protein